MTDDLVGRVARAFCAVDGADPCEVVCDWCLYRAAPVVAVCMEEAAKVLAAGDDGYDWSPDGAAAAIRALIPQESA